MSFDSLEYLVFLPVTVLLHWLCPARWRWAVLLLAGAVFYMRWSVPLTLLLASVIAVSYLAGLAIERAKTTARKKTAFALALTALLGLLVYFKYFGFLAESLAALLRLFGAESRWTLWEIVLPMGISFYTFQALSYVADVYRGDLRAGRHFGCYALYISFFPQLVAGPIERANNLLPQLRAERRFQINDIMAGLRLLLSGFFRKVVLADFCGTFVNNVYSAVAPDGSAVFFGAILFAFQIYNDFAGYSEIAAGSARLLGVRLMRNFDRPYLSGSVREFWRRWHISLSRWLTDYVYVPLGGSRRSFGRQIFATLAVFLVSGLWHGADWTFVAWGLLHGVYMAAELLLKRKNFPRLPKPAGVALTFALTTFAWIFFRAGTLAQAASFIGRLFSPWNFSAGLAVLGMEITDFLWFALALAQGPLLDRLTREAEERDITCVYALLTIAIAWVIRLQSNGANAFIYFQF